MEIVTKKKMMLFSGTTHPALAAEIAGHLGIQLSPCKISRFASGEKTGSFGGWAPYPAFPKKSF